MSTEATAIEADDLNLARMAFCRRPIPGSSAAPDLAHLTYADLLAETYDWARPPEPEFDDEEAEIVPLVGAGEIAWEERF